MGNSLNDQFLKTGLVDKQKAKKVKTEKRRQSQKRLKNKTETVNEAKNQIHRARIKQTERDRELNKSKDDALKRREISAQVKQLIELNKISIDSDQQTESIHYNFTDDNKIKKIEVSKIIHAQIGKGLLGIVKQDNYYQIIPAVVAEKIQQRQPEKIMILMDATGEDDSEDHLYSDYAIPDDLMW